MDLTSRVLETTILPFMFSELKTTDDDTVACMDESFVKNVGTIVIQIRRANGFTTKRAEALEPYSNDVAAVNIIDERAKKGSISHQASHGPEITRAPSNRIHPQYIDSKSGPAFAEFRFMYRSKMLLEMSDIIEAGSYSLFYCQLCFRRAILNSALSSISGN